MRLLSWRSVAVGHLSLQVPGVCAEGRLVNDKLP